MLRPMLYESFEDCRTFQLDFIKTCRDLIAAVQGTIKRFPDMDQTLAREVIAGNREIIKITYAELKEMQHWWNKEGKNGTKRLLEETFST